MSQAASRPRKKELRLWLWSNRKEQLNQMARALDLILFETIEYLLECAYDRELPNLIHKDTPEDADAPS